MTDDPYREPENSTVQDWFGQSAQRDQELADEVAGEAGTGSDAERRFEEQSHGAEQQRERHAGNSGSTGARQDS